MKIRQGFVSNSSSSSFCIYGICKESYDIEEILKAKGVTDEELVDGVSEYFDDWSYKWRLKDKGLSEEEIQKKCDERVTIRGMDIHHPYDGECGAFIGQSWSSINDDETGAEFKARIEKEIKAFFGDDAECSTYKEEWHC